MDSFLADMVRLDRILAEGRWSDATALCRTWAKEKGLPAAEMYKVARTLFIWGSPGEGLATLRHVAHGRYVPGEEAWVDLAHHLLICGLFLRPEETGDAYDELRAWGRKHEALAGRFPPVELGPGDEERPLRVGFLGLNFSRSNTMTEIWPGWFQGLEGFGFQRYAYVEERTLAPGFQLPVHFEVVREVQDLSDDALAERIRADRVDILVDLLGRMPENRLLVLARRPAPIQICFGPIATGLAAVDYYLSDAFVISEANAKKHVESIMYMPHSYFIWKPPVPSPVPLPRPSWRPFTFGCLNRECKTTLLTLKTWAEVLRRVPDSVLLLKDGAYTLDSARERVLDGLARGGVASQRIEFRGYTSREEHLATYQEIDVALDTVPEQGGVNTLESLWMGVPLVTWDYDERVLTRNGSSLLGSIGLQSWVAHDRKEYVDIAVALAEDTAQVRRCRDTLRDHLANSTLCDVEGYGRSLAWALRSVWVRACRHLPPADLRIPDARELTPL